MPRRLLMIAACLALSGSWRTAGAQPWSGSGLIPAGSAAVYLHPDRSPNRTLLREAGHDRMGAIDVTVMLAEELGHRLELVESWYSRSGDGDVILHGTFDHLRNEKRYYEPPVVLLDLPLEPGKSWAVRSRLRTERDDGSDETLIEQVRTVAGADTVTTPSERLPAVLVTESISAGPALGEMWYSPERGVVAQRADSAAGWLLMGDYGEGGVADFPWYGAPVDVRFNWPVNRRYRIDKFVTAVENGQVTADETSVSYTMTVEAVGDGRRITLGDFAPGGLSGNAALTGLADLMDGLDMSFVVDRDGAYAGLADPESMRNTLLALVAGIRTPPSPPREAARVDSLMRATITPQIVDQMAAAEWDLLAGAWLAVTAPVGTITEYDTEVPNPFTPGAGMRARLLAAAVGPAACDSVGADTSCLMLALSLHSRDAVAADNLLRALEEATPGDGSAGNGIVMDVRLDRSVVLDPATCFPRLMFVAKSVIVSSADGAGPEPTRKDLESIYYAVTPID